MRVPYFCKANPAVSTSPCRRILRLINLFYVLGLVAVFVSAACRQPTSGRQSRTEATEFADNVDETVNDGTIAGPGSPLTPPPELVSSGETYDTQPSLAMSKAGEPWAAWVGHSGKKGDRIYVARRQFENWTEPETVTPAYGNYLRPVLVAQGDQMVVLWTATGGETSIWMSRSAGGTWSAPTRVSPPGPHFNPEACVDGAGRLWMVWQGHVGNGYKIFLASYNGDTWSEPISVSRGSGNEWDPAITSDSNGKLWIAWSRFQNADYDLYLVSYENGEVSKERRLTDHRAYDLHPWLAVDGSDRLWLTWDRILVRQHGSSGTVDSTDGKLFNQGVSSGKLRWRKGKLRDGISEAIVKVACLADGKLLAPTTPLPKVGGPDYILKHCAYPKIDVDGSGNVWLALRTLNHSFHRPNTYWWDVGVTRYSGKGWSKPEILERSDGYLEEPALAAGQAGAWVGAQMEHRVTPNEGHPHPEQGSIFYEYDHHWAATPQGNNGDIYVTRFDSDTQTEELALQKAPRLSKSKSPLSERWISRESTRYEIEAGGKSYQLLFGDTHKHSNISRCSGGKEPSLDDHYRYSQDVCQQDFVVMSDHSNHSTDFNWWQIQKSADLYYVPGFFVTLFGYEISHGYPTGHMNVIMPERPAPILRYGLDKADSALEIWESLHGQKAITLRHTTAAVSGTNWSDHDPRYERLVEVFQAFRGSSEHEGAPRVHRIMKNKLGFVHNALAKGHKIGFIASTDHGFGAAYAVVYAESASREDVFEALYSRRCYASTSRGIVLDFRADGHLMGEEIRADSSANLSIMARAHAPIAQVDLFADQAVVRKWGRDELGKNSCQLTWEDPNPGTETKAYYVRVMLKDKELAWSSPIWVDYSDSTKSLSAAKTGVEPSL